MGPGFIVQTIHERRQGIDLLAQPYERKTFYASPDNAWMREVGVREGGFEILR
ncbi:hypothetical protein SAMN05880582_101525 [Rhizobium sp. RU20A]|uniref:hypothetical protein n=1 Tax=Rhizobium sp. RU20A TaxID=1907412 RepID=UPI000954E492|nr:hypothetical protein [Rhizobium sp. RU20A]SIQ04729.1 hypothetical protein SAMN05880582_101525 [Rhizobium sp. RU20A]